MGKNALEPLFDVFWNAGEVFFRWLFDGWIKPKTDFDPIFTETKLQNASRNIPLLVNEHTTDKTQTYVFSIPTGLTIADFMSRREAIAQFLKESPNNIKVELVNGMATITIFDTSKLNFNYHSYKFDYGGKLKIPIGVSLKDFSIVYLNLISPNECHLLIGGSTGSGKSVCLRVILEYLTCRDDVDLYLQDTKLVDLVDYENEAKVYNAGTDYALETVLGLVQEMENRYKYLRDKKLKNINEARGMKYIFYVVEELASFSPKDDKEYYKALAELLAKGRACGIIVIVTTQAPYSEILPGVLKNNINSIVGLKTRTHEASKVIIGDYDLLTGLRGKGHCILATAGSFTELQIFNI